MNAFEQGRAVGREDGKAWSAVGGIIRGNEHEPTQIAEGAREALANAGTCFAVAVRMRWREGYVTGFYEGATKATAATEGPYGPIPWDAPVPYAGKLGHEGTPFQGELWPRAARFTPPPSTERETPDFVRAEEAGTAETALYFRLWGRPIGTTLPVQEIPFAFVRGGSSEDAIGRALASGAFEGWELSQAIEVES